MSTTNKLIVLKNIEKAYENHQVIKSLELEIDEGKFIAILGDSGCGKSTLLNIIGLLDNQYNGDYFFDGEKITKKSNLDLIRKEKIGFVFQLYYLIPSLNIEENIMLPFLYKAEKEDTQNRLKEVINRLKLNELLDKRCSDLSGGEKQRVGIARALIDNPKLIICDEPTGNLDERNAKIIIDVLKEEKEKGSTIIVVTHSKEVARNADLTYFMENGVINLETCN